MIVKTSNGKAWIVKFNYVQEDNSEEIRYCKCPAVVTWTEVTTICSIRLAEHDYRQNICIQVHQERNDVFVKYIGRQLAFARLILSPVLNLSDEDKKLFVEAYNKQFHHKISLAYLDEVARTAFVISKTEDSKEYYRKRASEKAQKANEYRKKALEKEQAN